MFPPTQIQFGVSHRETGDEAADLTQMQEKSALVADMSGTSMDNAGPPSFWAWHWQSSKNAVLR